MPSHNLSLIIYPSPLFAAHWAFFLPSTTSSCVGTRIHADGSPATGFEVLVEEAYDLTECTQTWKLLELGEVDGEDMEKVARSVGAPEKSLVAVETGDAGISRAGGEGEFR